MDKDLNYQNYNERGVPLPNEGHYLFQKKALLTRMLKLSVARSQYLFAEIGRMSLESGQFQKSIIQLKKVLKIDPDHSYAQMSLAEAFLKLERENEAFSILKEVLYTEPGSTWAHQVVVGRLKDTERLGDLDSFNQEIAERETDPKAVAEIYNESAQALIRLNEHSKALDIYKKMFKENPNAGYNYEYAFALYHGGEFEEARVQFDKHTEWHPANSTVVNNMAFMTYCSGRLQEAFEEIEGIIEDGLVSSGTYSNFLLVLYQMGKDEEEINRYKDLFIQNLGENGPTLQSMYEEALRITRAILERDNIDEETRQFNTKKIEAINLVLSLSTKKP